MSAGNGFRLCAGHGQKELVTHEPAQLGRGGNCLLVKAPVMVFATGLQVHRADNVTLSVRG